MLRRAHISSIRCTGSERQRIESRRQRSARFFCNRDCYLLETVEDQLSEPNSFRVGGHDGILQWLCKTGQVSKAIHILSQILKPLSVDTYIHLLRSCVAQRSLFYAKEVYAHINRHHINLSGFLGDHLISSLAKCGSIRDALELCRTIPGISAYSWAVLIYAHVDSSSEQKALGLFREMQEQCVEPSSHALVGVLKACGNIKELDCGRHLHAYACTEGFTTNVFVGNTLINMYGKCGALTDAENVFLEMYGRDGVSWSALLAAYMEQGQTKLTLKLVRQMLEEGIVLNQHALVSSLRACDKILEAEEDSAVREQDRIFLLMNIGRSLHAYYRKHGFQSDVLVETALITLYGRCGALEYVTNVFLGMDQHDRVAWTAMLSVLLNHGKIREVLWLYNSMQLRYSGLNEFVFVILFQASGMLAKAMYASITTEISAFEIGRAIHIDACSYGCTSDNHVGTALVSMYSAFGALMEAEHVFRAIRHPDTVAWNSMLSAFVEQGEVDMTLQLYRKMQSEGQILDHSTFVLVLQAYNSILESYTGKEALINHDYTSDIQALHIEACKRGYLCNPIVGSALVCLYGKYRSMAEVEMVFNSVHKHDMATWTSILLACAEHGEDEKVLWLHQRMLKEGVHFDEASFVCILHACKKMGSLEACQRQHFDIVSVHHENCPAIALRIIETYKGCSSIVDADTVFDAESMPNILHWTVHISNDKGNETDCVTGLYKYEELLLQGLAPDESTLTSLLSTCCHAGLVTESMEYFDSIVKHYSLGLDPFHYTVLLDLICRAGDMQRVERILAERPNLGNLISWSCLLGACSSRGDITLAEKAFKRVVCVQPRQASAYVIISNIYANVMKKVM
ncbi:hypothetical protein KP509_19G039900 [Ceratopteris richardii]|nr:hypothetical protein KP509_19G039900 [Ceratopteris richardii]